MTRLLATDEQVGRAVEAMRAMQVEQVFLEVYRDGHLADESVLARARDQMLRAGLRVGGGLTTTWGEGFGEPGVPRDKGHGGLLCYSSPRTAEDIARLCALGAKLFEEFMLDDFFSTRCRCEACLAARGEDPWPAARNRLLADFAARAVIGPARAANPDCTVIIKYPQWYDNFQEVGYDVVAQSRQFDAVWVGTETRDPHRLDPFGPVQQSQSWSVYRWLADIAGPKTLGGWFDPYGCDEPSYVEQAYQTVLVGAPVMLLFNFDSLHRARNKPMLDSLLAHMPGLRRWASALGAARPAGLACYKPPHTASPGELYVFDYLTMIGIPITMHAGFPEGAEVVFLSGHALADPDAVDKTRLHLAAGRSVLASPRFVLGAGTAAGELFGLEPRGAAGEGPCRADAIQLAGRDHPVDGGLDVHAALEAADCEVLLTWRGADRRGPFLTRKRHGRAAAVMMDLYTQSLSDGGNMSRWVKVMDLAQPVLDRVREAAIQPLGLAFRGPGRVGLYCFRGGPVALCNYRNEPVGVELETTAESIVGPLAALTPEDQDRGRAAVDQRGDGRIRIQLPPRSRTMLTR